MSNPDSGQQPGKQSAQPGKDVQARAANISGRGNGFKKAVEDQEEAVRMHDLLRRSVVALCALASNENSAVGERLAEFKNSVQRAITIEEMEKSLCALKDTITRSEGHFAAGTERGSEPNACDTLCNRWEQPPVDGANGHREHLQSIFLGLIAEFDHDFGEEYSGRLAALRNKIAQSAQIQDIVGLKDDIVTLAQTYNQMINEERSLVTEFISEIGAGLLEVERQYLDSINQTGQSQSEDTKFNNLLENHVEDMKKSAQLSTTLAEFRGLVMSRLATIRSALEEKRRFEALRQERLREEMESLNQNLNRMKKEVDQVHEKRKALEKEILIDPMTGIANRRALKERLKSELYRFQRYRQYFSMLLFDVDHFKVINDQYGHWAGDRCLKEIIKRIRPILRETDFMGRWGGDEFTVIFPGTDLESAVAVAERLRKLIENTRFVYHRQEISLTVSIGVTEIQDSDSSQEMVFTRVDKAMYKAKKKGRNMVALL
ncbi:MAG: diguanylate cyclase [Syntrophobacteraceae bacterium]|jgi:diguanylate cyclase (GGDEF)-like protein